MRARSLTAGRRLAVLGAVAGGLTLAAGGLAFHFRAPRASSASPAAATAGAPVTDALTGPAARARRLEALKHERLPVEDKGGARLRQEGEAELAAISAWQPAGVRRGRKKSREVNSRPWLAAPEAR